MESQEEKKVWYWGRLITKKCPICGTPMPFSPLCAYCRNSLGDKVLDRDFKQKKNKSKEGRRSF